MLTMKKKNQIVIIYLGKFSITFDAKALILKVLLPKKYFLVILFSM